MIRINFIFVPLAKTSARVARPTTTLRAANYFERKKSAARIDSTLGAMIPYDRDPRKCGHSAPRRGHSPAKSAGSHRMSQGGE
jgi:hypothetical protein